MTRCHLKGASGCVLTPSILLDKTSQKEEGSSFFHRILRWKFRLYGWIQNVKIHVVELFCCIKLTSDSPGMPRGYYCHCWCRKQTIRVHGGAGTLVQKPRKELHILEVLACAKKRCSWPKAYVHRGKMGAVPSLYKANPGQPSPKTSNSDNFQFVTLILIIQKAM